MYNERARIRNMDGEIELTARQLYNRLDLDEQANVHEVTEKIIDDHLYLLKMLNILVQAPLLILVGTGALWLFRYYIVPDGLAPVYWLAVFFSQVFSVFGQRVQHLQILLIKKRGLARLRPYKDTKSLFLTALLLPLGANARLHSTSPDVRLFFTRKDLVWCDTDTLPASSNGRPVIEFIANIVARQYLQRLMENIMAVMWHNDDH
jgi:hypothetical protein